MPRAIDKAKLSLLVPNAPSRSQQVVGTPPEPDRPSLGAVLAAGFGQGNLTSTLAKAVEVGGTEFVKKAGYQPSAYLAGEGREEFSWLLPAIEADSNLADVVALTESPEELRFLGENIKRKHHQMQTAMDRGGAIGFSAIIAGAIVDWPSLIPGVGFAKGSLSLFNTIRAARAAGAARLGVFGALEGAAFGAAESVSDPSVGALDIFGQTLIGGGIGGVIGGAFPRAANAVKRPHLIEHEGNPDAAAEALGAGSRLKQAGAVQEAPAPAPRQILTPSQLRKTADELEAAPTPQPASLQEALTPSQLKKQTLEIETTPRPGAAAQTPSQLLGDLGRLARESTEDVTDVLTPSQLREMVSLVEVRPAATTPSALRAELADVINRTIREASERLTPSQLRKVVDQAQAETPKLKGGPPAATPSQLRKLLEALEANSTPRAEAPSGGGGALVSEGTSTPSQLRQALEEIEDTPRPGPTSRAQAARLTPSQLRRLSREIEDAPLTGASERNLPEQVLDDGAPAPADSVGSGVPLPGDVGTRFAGDVSSTTLGLPTAPGLVSAKSRIGNASAASKKASMAEKGFTAIDEAVEFAMRLMTFHTATEAEVAGRTIRRKSADEIQDAFEQQGGTHLLAGRMRYNETVEAMFNGRWDLVWRDTGVAGIKLPRRKMTELEFLHMADMLADARFHGEPVRSIMPNTLSADQLKTLEKALDDQAAADNAFWDGWKNRLLEEGFIEPDQVPAGPFRPQLWNLDEIKTNRLGFKNYLFMALHQEPPAEWLRSKGFIEEGGFYGDLVKKDRQAAEDARNQYWGENANTFLDRADEVLEEARKTLGAKRDAAGVHILSTQREKIHGIEARKLALEDKLAKSTTDAGRLRWQRAIVKIDEELETAQAAYRKAETLVRGSEDLLSMAQRSGKEGVRLGRGLQKATAAVKKADDLVEALRLEPTPEAQIDGIVNKMIGTIPENPHGFLPSSPLIQQTGRFMDRTIDISKGWLRQHPQTQQFKKNDSLAALRGYIKQVGSRVAIKEALGGLELEEVIKKMNKRFNEDIQAAEVKGDVAARDLLVKAQDSFTTDFEKFGDVFTGTAQTRDGTGRFVSQQLTRTANSVFLGSSNFSLYGDITLMELAHGRAGTLLKQFWNAPGTKRALNDLAKQKQHRLTAMLRGVDVLYASDIRAIRLAEMDDIRMDRSLGAPGSLMRSISKASDATTKALSSSMMYANMTVIWNRFMRTTFADTFLFNTLDDFAGDFGAIPKRLQEKYRRLGVGPEEAARIGKLMREGKTVTTRGRHGATAYPDLENWPAVDAENLERVVDGAAREGIIVPSIGDMPWMASHPVGRLVLQFQGFAFASQQKYVRPGMQSQKDGLFYYTVGLGFLASGLGDFLRHANRGDGQEWIDRWETQEGAVQNVYGAFLRHPMAAASSASLSEAAVTTGSRPINNVLQTMGLAPLVPTTGRFQKDQALFRLFGPSAAMAQGGLSGVAALTGALTGDGATDGLKRAAHVLPFSSHFIFRRWEAYQDN